VVIEFADLRCCVALADLLHVPRPAAWAIGFRAFSAWAHATNPTRHGLNGPGNVALSGLCVVQPCYMFPGCSLGYRISRLGRGVLRRSHGICNASAPVYNSPIDRFAHFHAVPVPPRQGSQRKSFSALLPRALTAGKVYRIPLSSAQYTHDTAQKRLQRSGWMVAGLKQLPTGAGKQRSSLERA